MFATLLRRDRERNGLRIARAPWLVGVTAREYREIEPVTKAPDWDTYERVCEPFGWTRSFVTDTRLLGPGS
jgi:Helix-turn-helix domain